MSANFWAQNADTVKSPTHGRHPPSPPTPPEPISEETSRQTFKAMYNSERNMEDKWESFESKKKKDLIQEKDKRILELEAQLQHKDRHILELAAAIDEKDRKIEMLEVKLETIAQRIHELENVFNPVGQLSDTDHLSVQNCGNKTTEVLSSDSWADMVEEDILSRPFSRPVVEEPQLENSPLPTGVDTLPKVSRDVTPALSEISTDGTATLSKASTGDAPMLTKVSDEDLPALPKRAPGADLAPVKPAPKLSFPMKNGGKVAAKTNGQSLTEKVPHILTSGQQLPDLRHIPKAEREALYQGPTITVIVGDTQVRGVPKHMFMAASPKVKDYFLKNPAESYIAFPGGQIAVPVMEAIKDWLKCMGTLPVTFSLKLSKNTFKDLPVRRDCMYLGMDKYVGHFTKQYCDRIRNEGMDFLTPKVIEAIVNNTTDSDSLFQCLADNLAALRRRGKISGPKELEKVLDQHPRLVKAMDRICGRLTRKRGPKKRAVPGADYVSAR